MLALALTGCIQPIRPAPPRDALIPPTTTFTMPDGTTLPARVWLPPPGTPQIGTILALHGYTDSRDGWEIPAPSLADAGYAIYAPDQRGFGATATRGTWPGTTQLVNDAATLVQTLRARAPTQPVIVMGESMGGAIAAILAATPTHPADATILLAPAVWGWQQLDTPLAFALRLTNAVAPAWAPDPNEAPGDYYASDNIPALIRFGRDPLTLRRPPISMTKGVVDLMTEAQNAMPNLHGPVLIAAGARDEIIPPTATEAAWSKLPPTARRATYPNGYHLLLRDKDRALVLADILSWLATPNAWLPSAADAATAARQSTHPWTTTPSPLTPAAHADGFWQTQVWRW